MLLRFCSDAEPRDLVVTVEDPDATVADLAEALAPDQAVGPLLIDGRPVAPSTPLDRAGIGDGAVIARGAHPAAPDRAQPAASGRPVASLVVTSGFDAGRSFDLTPGIHRIGRASTDRDAPDSGMVIDDPTVSGHHGSVSVDAGGRVTVADEGSRNGTWIDDRAITTPTPIEHGATFRCGAARVQLRAVAPPIVVHPADSDTGTGEARTRGPRPHHRSPRAELPRPVAPVPVPGPPEAPSPVSPVGVVAVVASLGLGAVMVVVLGSWTYAVFALLGPVVMLANGLDGRRRRRRQRRHGDRRRRKALASLEADVRVACRAEAERRDARFAGMAVAAGAVAGSGPACWERRPEHPDAFEVRIGIGETGWDVPVETTGPTAPDVARVLDRQRVLHEAAIGVRLRPGRSIALVGPPPGTSALARAMVVQAAVIHGPADLRVSVLAAEAHAPRWDWCAWLPHRHSPATGSLLATSADAARVADALTEPVPPSEPSGPPAVRRPTTVVIVDDPAALAARRSPARAVLRAAADLELALVPIVLVEALHQVPAVCTTVVTVSEGGTIQSSDPEGPLRRDPTPTPGRPNRTDRDGAASEQAATGQDQEPTAAEAGARRRGATLVGCSVAVAAGVGRALARLEDPEVDDVGRGLPDRISLPAVLGGERWSTARVLARWRAAGPDPEPTATLGMSADGPLTVDLAVDGPHALVAGTTGSGKSELLRTLVASLAASASPDHLSFVLVDFKGGSAFDACARLPHTVGVVTDLDAQLAARALRCLEAELRHRETRLRVAGADNLAGLRRACPHGPPLPRLVVVIDEFATLAAELPDFVESLVGIAQRGRSLGVHLVLATQRPSGSVSEHIKANAALRIALRVQSGNDSTDVIDTADAASIPRQRPGRALVRFGPGELVAAQTALASEPANTAGPRSPVRVRPLGLSGARGEAPIGPAGGEGTRTELDELVDVVAGAWAEAGGAPPRRPWPEPLTPNLAWPVVGGPVVGDLRGADPRGADPDDADACGGGQPGADQGSDRSSVAIGLADEPDRQRQVPYRWDLDDGTLLLVGLPGSGTSTAAATAVLEVARTCPPEEAHVHVIDLGAGHLSALAGLPHVGAVIGAEETERQRRLLARLGGELADRRARSRDDVAGLGRRFLVVDGLGAFTDRWGDLDRTGTWDRLVELVTRGGEVGIHVVLAAEGPTAAPHRLVARCPQRLVFRLGDRADYAPFAIAARDVPAMVPGRCIDAGLGLVVQVARPPGGLAAVVAQLAGRSAPPMTDPVGRAAPVAVLPTCVSRREAVASRGTTDAEHAGDTRAGRTPGPPTAEARTAGDGDLELVVGISDEGLGPARLILPPGGHAVVAGPPRSGRSTALATIAQCGRDAGLRVVVVVAARRTAGCLGDVVHPDDLDQRLADASAPMLVVVDDADLTAETHPALTRLVTDRRADRHVVAAGRSDRLRGLYAHWVRELRADRTGLLLVPDPDVDGELTGARLPRTPPVAMVPGRAWLSGGDPEGFLQVAQPDP